MPPAQKPTSTIPFLPFSFPLFHIQTFPLLLILVACLPVPAGAYIYPTEPVQKSVWIAGTDITIKWANDEKTPSLAQTGLTDVGLWMNTDTFLGDLADNVDPTTMAVQVRVPRDGIDNNAIYTVHFTPHNLSLPIVYTADFHIRAAADCTNNATIASTAVQAPAGNQTSGSSCIAAAEAVLPNSTVAANMTSGPNGTAATPSSDTSKAQSTTQPLHPGDGAQQQQQLGPSSANAAGRRVFDVEKFKFRLVFIIWPALIGVTMAM